MNSGYLSIHMGCMRAEKSVFACKKATKYADLGESVIFVRSSLDEGRQTEGGDDLTFSSHSSSNRYLSPKVKTMSCEKLKEIEVDEYNVIIIDEGQFFEDLVESCLDWVDEKQKIVYVVGLDSSYKRTKIGNIVDLIPHADYYEKFTAKCSVCFSENTIRSLKYTKAIFTARRTDLSESTDSVIKPGTSEYVSVCRHHYNALNK